MSRDWTNLLWSQKTWWERTQTAFAFCVALIIALGMFGGGLMVFGSAVDGITEYNVQHDRCLKKATNGYEIKQCR